MNAISLWQPWASLVVAGIKHWETRSWDTTYRGLLAIHATKTVPPRVKRLIDEERTEEAATLKRLMNGMGYQKVDDMPMGAILGIVVIKETVPAEKVIPVLVWHRHLGDFSHGRFAWRLASLVKFDTPFPARGRQGLWEWAMPAQAAYQISRATGE